jgi:D-glucosaminate-6-phosphate ammonia-lyase
MSIYQRFGVTPIINASGAVTRLGGAPMPDAVLEAFHEAAGEWAPLEQLQAAAARQIARVTGAESGLVTAGCAAALTLGTAAILTGNHPGKMERLPHCDGMRREFVVAREQRSGYDHAVRLAGARLVEVGFNEIVANAGVRRTEAWEYEEAFGPETAGVLYVFSESSQPPLRELVERAHRHSLPVLVDAAGELPPRAHLKSIVATGADLVAFSGGKAIRGPQSTGILCGRRELVGAAAAQLLDMDDHPVLWNPPEDFIDARALGGIPRHGIGRTMKVSKEEIVALLVALDLFASGAYDSDLPRYREWLSTIAAALQNRAAVCTLIDPPDGESLPILEIALDERRLGRTAFDICRSLREGAPGIYVGHGKLTHGILVVNPLCLNAERAVTLAQALQEQVSSR